MNAQATNRVELSQSSPVEGSAREAPGNALRAVEVEPIRECLGDVELAARDVWPLIDHLRQHFATVEADVQPDAAREHRMRDPFGRLEQRSPTGGAGATLGWSVRSGLGGVVTGLCSGHDDCGGKAFVLVPT